MQCLWKWKCKNSIYTSPSSILLPLQLLHTLTHNLSQLLYSCHLLSVQLYLQMQGMSSSNSNENLSTQDEDGDSCFEDINQILSMDTCFDFHDNVWDRLSSGRHNLHPSFWESDNIATCINEDYELIGLTHGVHILVGAQPIVLGRCPIIAVDSIPGLFDKQVTLVPSSGFLSENQKKRFLNFHNQMTLAQFREAVVNARISTKETSSSYNFMSNNCATFPLDILSWLGIDFKGVHREAVTTLVLKGLMSSKETTDKVMSVIR